MIKIVIGILSVALIFAAYVFKRVTRLDNHRKVKV